MQEQEEQLLGMNFNELIKCFTELSPLIPDLMEVIQSIKAGDWSEVVIKSIELASKGYPIVKECISAFTKQSILTWKPPCCWSRKDPTCPIYCH